MATINARIDDNIKARADEVLKRLDISQTQAITAFYQYIAESGKLPFKIDMQVRTPDDIAAALIRNLTDALNILLMIQRDIEHNEVLNGKTLLIQERQLEALYRSVADSIGDVDNSGGFERALAALRRAISACVDFKDFGYGKALVRIDESEYPRYAALVRYFQDSLDDISQENGA
jgi:RHH-type rel operon transcriptional repressor/antitoxin RelB